MKSHKNDLLHENIILKKKVAKLTQQQKVILQRALKVEYYTSLEYDKLIEFINSNISALNKVLVKLNEMKDEFENEQCKLQRNINSSSKINLSFVNKYKEPN